jgi:hypothetical protein
MKRPADGDQIESTQSFVQGIGIAFLQIEPHAGLGGLLGRNTQHLRLGIDRRHFTDIGRECERELAGPSAQIEESLSPVEPEQCRDPPNEPLRILRPAVEIVLCGALEPVGLKRYDVRQFPFLLDGVAYT